MCKVITGDEIQTCSNPGCWKQGKEPMDFELPYDLQKTLKCKARIAGLDYTEFVSILLTDAVRKNTVLMA
jgi:hypothetical protein